MIEQLIKFNPTPVTNVGWKGHGTTVSPGVAGGFENVGVSMNGVWKLRFTTSIDGLFRYGRRGSNGRVLTIILTLPPPPPPPPPPQPHPTPHPNPNPYLIISSTSSLTSLHLIGPQTITQMVNITHGTLTNVVEFKQHPGKIKGSPYPNPNPNHNLNESNHPQL